MMAMLILAGEETIKCLQADLKRSFEYMTEFKPK